MSDTKFNCALCETNLSTKANLQMHLESVHENKKNFQCDLCQQEFYEKHQYSKHIESVHKALLSELLVIA